jgi:hypothetical protein
VELLFGEVGLHRERFLIACWAPSGERMAVLATPQVGCCRRP